MTGGRVFAGWLAEAGVGPGPREDLARFLTLLERWSGVHNLVSFDNPRELVDRHVVEALAGEPTLADDPGLLVDVGSGAGFPGVPLLTACRGWTGVLLEPRLKRWAFLRLVVRELGLSCEVRRERYEDATDLADIGCLTVRGVAGHASLVRWAASRLRPGGEVVAWVGERVCDRLGEVPGWHVISSGLPTGGGHVVRLHLESGRYSSTGG